MQSTETQNYDYLYEKLEEFYQLKIMVITLSMFL